MFLKNIELKNFRCYEDLSIDFREKVSVIVGANGAAGCLAGLLAKDLYEQLAGAVHDLGLLAEILGAGYEAQELDDALHAVQVTNFFFYIGLLFQKFIISFF